MRDLRILVVDDSEAFRRFIYSTLEQSGRVQIIGQASDGLEAVQLAQKLQPDLILLVVGLPSLNGLEVARRVRTLAPAAKILFLSVDTDTDLVKEALSLAEGYIYKPRLRNDLLPAIEAVFRGERFVSRAGFGYGSLPWP